jgi:hypothetical protein
MILLFLCVVLNEVKLVIDKNILICVMQFFLVSYLTLTMLVSTLRFIECLVLIVIFFR